MYIGAQLYTVREFTQTAEDFDKAMKKVAEMGYKYVQISAIGPIEATTVRGICDKYNLEIVLTHTNQDRMLNDSDKVIEEHKIYGAKYVGIGSMPEKFRPAEDDNAKLEGIHTFIELYKPFANKLKEHGMMLMYHNHDFEFEKINGKLMIDYLIEGFEPDLMGFTLDVFWVQAGGGDPVFWLNKLSGRIDTIHYKDMIIKNRSQLMAEVMEGNLNWQAIFEASKSCGVKWAFVEQDHCYGKDPFECLEISYKNLSKFFVN